MRAETILGLIVGIALVVAGFVFDLPAFTGWIVLALIFGGWMFFAVRDRHI